MCSSTCEGAVEPSLPRSSLNEAGRGERRRKVESCNHCSAYSGRGRAAALGGTGSPVLRKSAPCASHLSRGGDTTAANRQASTAVAGANFRHYQEGRRLYGHWFARRRSIEEGQERN